MQSTILQIGERSRKRLSQISSLSNFDWTPGDSADPQIMLDDPNWSLFCLDHTARQAVFAELPPGIDLAQAPFVYQAQFEQARRLMAVPYEALHPLAAQIPLDPARLILIHNVGRCGSTLLSSALNELDGVISLSEPDVIANFLTIRNEDRAELIDLLHDCARLLFRPAVVGNASRFSLKFRNQCVEIMDLYHAAFPQAKHLFLYRDSVGWVASLYRLMSRRSTPPPMSRTEAVSRQSAYYNRSPESVERFFDPAVDSYTRETYLAAGWLIMMDRYLELRAQGITPLAVRYADLNAQPERVLRAIFDFCGLPREGISQATARLRAGLAGEHVDGARSGAERQ